MYHHRDALDPEEHRRFAAMNDMLNPTSVGMLGLRGGERILDVGCGLGQLTRAMARSAGRSGGAMGIAHSEPWLREAERLGALRMAKTALKLRETEVTGSLGDEDALRVLNTLIKQRRDSAEQFRAAGREDLAQKEEREATIIQQYLPSAASADDMARAVQEAVVETGATSPKDMGVVMKAARARLQGMTIDGKTLSDLVKSRLAS